MRALLSVYDKSGLEHLARGLTELGWELVASGKTSAALGAAGIPHHEVADVTGAPEMLGGRVKTLHPTIAGGILADRSNPDHMADLEARGIEPIDLVVCNLYPFPSEPSVEMIDIGGPTMVRAAAKNYDSVGVVVDPGRYPAVLAELRDVGSLTFDTRRELARDAFAHVAEYDAAILDWFDGPDGPGGPGPPDGPGVPPDLMASVRPSSRMPSCCPPPSSSPWSGPARCATARTLTSAGPATASPASPRGGMRWSSTRAPSSPISTSSTPTPPGAWSTSWLIRRFRWAGRGGHHQTRQPVRGRGGGRPPDRLPQALECDELRPSEGSWPWAARWTRRWPRPSPRARRPTSSSPPPSPTRPVTDW